MNIKSIFTFYILVLFAFYRGPSMRVYTLVQPLPHFAGCVSTVLSTAMQFSSASNVCIEEICRI